MSFPVVDGRENSGADVPTAGIPSAIAAIGERINKAPRTLEASFANLLGAFDIIVGDVASVCMRSWRDVLAWKTPFLSFHALITPTHSNRKVAITLIMMQKEQR